MDREKIIKEFKRFVDNFKCFSTSDDYDLELLKAVYILLEDQQSANDTQKG